MQLIQAIAKSAPRQVNTRYGQKTVIDATGRNGEEITIWRGGDDRSPSLASITNGSRISVGMDSKGKYSLLETPADRAQTACPISPEIEPAAKHPMGFAVAIREYPSCGIESTTTAIDARIEELGRVYAQCLAVANGSEAAALVIFQAAIA